MILWVWIASFISIVQNDYENFHDTPALFHRTFRLEYVHIFLLLSIATYGVMVAIYAKKAMLEWGHNDDVNDIEQLYEPPIKQSSK